MSVKQIAAVWDRNVGDVYEQAVLLALADHADHDGQRVYPSIAKLAWQTALSERKVQYVMRSFRDRGIVEVVREGGGRQLRLGRGGGSPGAGVATEYRLRLDKLPTKLPFIPLYQRVHDVHPSPAPEKLSTGGRERCTGCREGCTECRERCTGVHPIRPVDPSYEPSGGDAPRQAASDRTANDPYTNLKRRPSRGLPESLLHPPPRATEAVAHQALADAQAALAGARRLRSTAGVGTRTS